MPALTTVDPTVVTSLNTGLVDGQRITVTVAGFGVGGEVRLSECASARDANAAGCGLQLAEQTLLVTNERRTGSAAFIVHARAGTGPHATDTVPCAFSCVVVATLGVAPGGSAGGYAEAPIAFRGPVARYGANGVACDPRSLAVAENADGGPGGALGYSSVEIVVTNTGRATCSLSGYPTVSFADTNGRLLAFAYRHGDGTLVTLSLIHI